MVVADYYTSSITRIMYASIILYIFSVCSKNAKQIPEKECCVIP